MGHIHGEANGVNTAQIADGAITALKLGPGAVTSNARNSHTAVWTGAAIDPCLVWTAPVAP